MKELIRVSGLQVHFPIRGSFIDTITGRAHGVVRAVDGIDLAIEEGEVLGAGRRIRLGQDHGRARDDQADPPDRGDHHLRW